MTGASTSSFTDDPAYDLNTVAALAHLSIHSLQSLIGRGNGPRFEVINGKRLVRRSVAIAWNFARQAARSTARAVA